jgi:transposase
MEAYRPVDLELTDEQWMRISPLLPVQKPVVGRPMLDHRRSVDSIPWVAETGAIWRDLSPVFGPWHMVHSRYRRWRSVSIWHHVLDALR